MAFSEEGYMSSFYIMRYQGQTGAAFGAIYIGRGIIIGVDAGNGRYRGTYTEASGRLRGSLTLTLPSGGSLVTGQTVPPGTAIPINFDWPVHFTDGSQQVSVQGQQVHVTFEKIGDIP
jgi:hypothetical protein